MVTCPTTTSATMISISWGALGRRLWVGSDWVMMVNELDDGKFYRKTLYLMVKSCKIYGFL